MNIRDRILARRDLDQLRKDRMLEQLATKLNEECVEIQVPRHITASDILSYAPYSDVVMNLLTAAAAGESVQALAQALLSDQGTVVMEPGLEPAPVTAYDVSVEMYFPNGQER